MQTERRKVEDVLPSDSRGHLHISITLCAPYALRMQPYAVRMHFSPASRKPMKSRDERTSKKPYALYAPLLGVGPFSAFFLLRELHTVHTAAYGRRWNRALALLSVGIGTLPARQNQKCIRRCIRLSGRKTPISPLSTEYPESGYSHSTARLPGRWADMAFFGPCGASSPRRSMVYCPAGRWYAQDATHKPRAWATANYRPRKRPRTTNSTRA